MQRGESEDGFACCLGVGGSLFGGGPGLRTSPKIRFPGWGEGSERLGKSRKREEGGFRIA